MDSLPAYVGADVVPRLIEFNTKRFAHHSNKHFIKWDFSVCPIPMLRDASDSADAVPFDLIHTRDVLQHMPLDKAVAAAENIRTCAAVSRARPTSSLI